VIARNDAPMGDKALTILADDEPGTVVGSGGYGSGKTTLGVAWVVKLGLGHGQDGPILGTEPSYPMVRDVMERTTMECLDRWRLPYRHWKADHIFEIGRAKRFEFWCRSLDKPRSVEGINAIGLWADEWELCDPEALVPALQRVRAGKALRSILTGTPEGYGPAYDLILARPSPTTRAYIIRTADNPFLPASYVEESKARLGTDEAISEKLDGIRTAKGGRVYTRFDRRRHCAAPVVKHGRIVIACDFNVRYSHWIVAIVDEVRKVAHIVGEVIKEGGTTTDEHAERMATWIAGYIERTTGRRPTREDVFRMKIPAYIDASGTSLHTTSSLSDVHLLLQAGFVPMHGTRNPPIKDRVNTVNVLLRDGRVSFDMATSSVLVRGLETQAYDKAGEPEKKPGSNLDHGIDALGYLLHTQWPVHAPKPNMAPARSAGRDEWGPLAP
jgi:hypothetical protein